VNRAEVLIRAGRWAAARRELRRELALDPPDNHWLLTRLSLTYYEERKYRMALRYVEQALVIAPWCPLVLWDHAGTLQMLGRHGEALQVYRRLVRRGAARLAHGRCGEGLGWARGLVADCYYRMMVSLDALGERRKSIAALTKHLDLRGPGCYSIYPLKTLGQRLRRPDP
jgi:hypothetical protein